MYTIPTRNTHDACDFIIFFFIQRLFKILFIFRRVTINIIIEKLSEHLYRKICEVVLLFFLQIDLQASKFNTVH